MKAMLAGSVLAEADVAWSYPTPFDSAIEKVGRDFSGYVTFGKAIKVPD